MCTVTYFPLKDKIILTSNRDEKPHRSAQEIHTENGVFTQKMLQKKEPGLSFPKVEMLLFC